MLSQQENSVQASGQWIQDKNYGLQFKASTLQTCAPTTVEGIEKYLGSGLIKGIGPVYAKKLVKAFGDTVFEVIEHTPEILKTVAGVGPHRAHLITKGWSDQKVIREIMVFLYQNGISTTRAVRIYKTYGAQAISLFLRIPIAWLEIFAALVLNRPIRSPRRSASPLILLLTSTSRFISCFARSDRARSLWPA